MNDLTNIRIAVCQMNTTVGDLDGNKQKILQGIDQAVAAQCDIVTFPELTITGYPPEDLLLRKNFIADQRVVVQELAKYATQIITIVGFVDEALGKKYNAAAILAHSKIQHIYHKIQLPNYSVFDEERYFSAGISPSVVEVNGITIGINICEDIWIPNCVTESEALVGGAEILINISASPFAAGKGDERIMLMRNRAKTTHAAVIYNNLVGGQDELVFDGRSLVCNAAGELLMQGKDFTEDFLIIDVDVEEIRALRQNAAFQTAQTNFYFPFQKIDTKKITINRAEKLPALHHPPLYKLTRIEEIYHALVLGLRDYVAKNGFRGVVFGLSGGIDSALVAAIAADALGPENVHCITMPSQFSSKGSVDDSVQLAKNFNIDLKIFPIKAIFDDFMLTLEDSFKDTQSGIAEENLQARIRGNLVMALSNKFSWIALATGNKSEVSVGYCTIYGDMVGGYAPLKDVMKTMVYQLSEYRNSLAGYDIIPRAIIEKAPSAELRPDQKDEDSLPPYDILDDILEKYIEQAMGVQQIINSGHDTETVKRVARLVDLNEYKRRQAAPGTKITPLAFGKDRRMPITNHYRAK